MDIEISKKALATGLATLGVLIGVPGTAVDARAGAGDLLRPLGSSRLLSDA